MTENIYAHWAKVDVWLLQDAITLFADYSAICEKVKDPHKFYLLKNSLYSSYENELRKSLREAKHTVYEAHYMEYDNPDTEQVLDLTCSYEKSKNLIMWADGKGYDLPDEFKAIVGHIEKSKSETVKPNEGPLTADERRRFGQLKLQKEKMDMTIRAAVKAATYYGSMNKEDKFDKYMLFDKLAEWGYVGITDASIEIIYQELPPDHKRGPGEKKTNDKR